MSSSTGQSRGPRHPSQMNGSSVPPPNPNSLSTTQKSSPTRTPHGRLLPDHTLQSKSSLINTKKYFDKFMDDNIRVHDDITAVCFIRAIIRQHGEKDSTEDCLTALSSVGTGLCNLVDALTYSLDDPQFLNESVGQFLVFLGHKYKANDPALERINFDNMVRMVMQRIVRQCQTTLLALADATKKAKLNSASLEGFAWFLTEYIEFSITPPEYIEDIVHDKDVLDKFCDATANQYIRQFGNKLRYWDNCEGSKKQRAANGYGPGGRHDNDCENIRDISIMPTPDEIHSRKSPYLPKLRDSLNQEGLARIGTHLDCNFRLLREEMLNEFRSDFREFIKDGGYKSSVNNVSERSKLVLENVQWGGWDYECCVKHRKFGVRLHVDSQEIMKRLKISKGSFSHLLSEDSNFPYRNNSVACLVIDDEIAGFGHLNRDVECLREAPACVILTLDSTKTIEFLLTKVYKAVVNKPEDAAKFKLICVDTPVFAHEPILQRLQAMREIPLAEELLHFKKGDKIAKTTCFPEHKIKSILPGKPLRDFLKVSTAMVMDKAQGKAVLSSVQNKVSLIQGPPGTGKTMIGNIIAKLMYMFTKEKILIITQQNHICDEFLGNMLEMGVKREDAVRLGAGYSHSTRCVALNEISDDKDIFQSAKNAMELVQTNLLCAWLPVDELYSETFANPMTWTDIQAMAVVYNEPNPVKGEEKDLYGYRAAFTVPAEFIDVIATEFPTAPVPTDVQIFHMWATGAKPPPMLFEFMPEKGREIWELEPDKRAILLEWFREGNMRDQIWALAQAATAYNKLVDELQNWKDTRITNVLTEKRIIAGTTNGAAKFLESIAKAAPTIIIVEEAAQIFESHVLAALHPNVQQLILIGDHKQLRPRCDTWELRHESKHGYDLDISLFERLIHMGFPYVTLETQHRARPEISQLIRATYPELLDAPSVTLYSNVRGMRHNLFWMHHENREASAKHLTDRASSSLKRSSKVNEFEANMVVSIVRYLGVQGYSSDHIAIITPYLGQVALISKMIREKSSFDVILSQMDYHELVRAGLMEARDVSTVKKYVEVCTVDQFQGSDRDIIIVSMVRSNPEHQIGFLRSPERANVLLSRARKGLFILGDVHTAIGGPQNPTPWGPVVDMLMKEKKILEGIPIICEKHPDQAYDCATPEQLDWQTPEGRCRLRCDAPLPCKKHTCSYFCHPGDDHSQTICDIQIERTCSRGHKFTDNCWQPKGVACKKCSRIDAHYEAINESEANRKTEEFEAEVAVEKARKKAADEEYLEMRRKRALEQQMERRLIAEGKTEAPYPKRTSAFNRPIGKDAVKKPMKAERHRGREHREHREREAEQPKKDIQVEQPKKDIQVEQPKKDIQVEQPKKDIQVEHSAKGPQTEQPKKDEAVAPMKNDREVEETRDTKPSRFSSASASASASSPTPSSTRNGGPSRHTRTPSAQAPRDPNSPHPWTMADLERRFKRPTEGKRSASICSDKFNSSSPIQSPGKQQSFPDTPHDMAKTTDEPANVESGDPATLPATTTALETTTTLEIDQPTSNKPLSDNLSTNEFLGTLIKYENSEEDSDIEIYIEKVPSSQPRIVQDDVLADIEMEAVTESIQAKSIDAEMSPLIPSSPPIRLTQHIPLDDETELPQTVVEDTLISIEGVSETKNHGLQPDAPAVIEQPSNTAILQEFLSSAVFEEHTASNVAEERPASSGAEEPSTSTKTNSSPVKASIEMEDVVLSTTSHTITVPIPPVPATIIETPTKGTGASSKQASDPITSSPKSGGPKSVTPSTSRSRYEWERQKLLNRDSNIALDKIMDMVGMEHVKEQVLTIKAKAETVHRQGIDIRDERFHIALLGNPGTGKTSFARLYSKFLRSEGLLESVKSVETNGAKLANSGVAGIEEIFKDLLSVKGGTLFIDEAYQLITSGSLEGRQVLDFLLSEMEKHLGKIIVIISGYNKEMEKFFEHNPGLNSRIPYRVQFEDFTNDELLYLLQDVIKKKFKNKMMIEDGYDGLYMRIVSKRLGRMRGMAGCGNARSVQNTVAKMLERQAARVTKELKHGFEANDFYLTKEDIIGPAPTKAAMESPVWKELHQLIGLTAVKESVSVLLKRMERNYQRELAEERPIDISLNRVFLGSPGTGKTSVAKIYGKILAQLGLLSSGEVIMKTPSDFVGRALGESEANTKAILNAARGKVLIIDEAYMLTPKIHGNDDPYKTAVIDTIVSEVQNVPGDDQCVLLLGYKEDLEKMFQNANPGLSRRFPISDGFVFEDFTDVELARILDLKLRLAELDASQEARDVAIQKISQKRQKSNFGNAGEVENLLNVAKERMLKRQIDGEDMTSELLAIDFDPDHDRGTRADNSLRDLFKDLIGVDDVMQRFEDYQTTAMMMRGRGIDPQQHIPMLFIFKGPPGTGKTTTARKMGQIFYNMGFLASSEVVECSASDLTAEYLGQTAQKTRKKLESALGKVLFIDEAYRLQDNQYGTEASNELVDAVTKPQYMGKLVVILAGYDEGMNRLLAVNVGLASRFSEVIDFPDINHTTAIEILKAEIGKAQAMIPSLDGPASEGYEELVMHMQEITKAPGWGHARDALNLSKSMVAAAFRGIKSIKDPIVVTHAMAVKVMTDMLRQRKGRVLPLPVAMKAPVDPASTRIQYQEPQALPKININTETADVCKAQESSTHHGSSASSVPTDTTSQSRKEDEVPRLFQEIDQREFDASDEDWGGLLQSREREETNYNVQFEKRAKLRRHLSNSRRFLKRAVSEVAELGAQGEADSKLQGSMDYQIRLSEAERKEADARRTVEDTETKLTNMIQNEKLIAAKERVNLCKLDLMGMCPKRYHWIKVSDGYRCGGGEHFVSNEEVAAYQMPM
ncbi:hypothetical protein AA313_de0210225 [Arthrobotrys entomopaga]|nr:hypothetical protein AA313_de0210225 [Arthrobotrys entomopaga]